MKIINSFIPSKSFLVRVENRHKRVIFYYFRAEACTRSI
jgi:hypothetical protein